MSLDDFINPSTASWAGDAACRGLDPELFFPMQGPTAGETVRQAKKICWESCTVRQECEDYGVEHERHFGVFGGWTVRERRRLRLGEALPRPDDDTAQVLTLDLDWDDDYPQAEVA